MVRRGYGGATKPIIVDHTASHCHCPYISWIMWALGTTSFMDLLLPGVMDSLAMGALLAYAVKYPPQAWLWAQFVRLHCRCCSCFALGVWVQCSGNNLLSRVALVLCSISLPRAP